MGLGGKISRLACDIGAGCLVGGGGPREGFDFLRGRVCQLLLEIQGAVQTIPSYSVLRPAQMTVLEAAMNSRVCCAARKFHGRRKSRQAGVNASETFLKDCGGGAVLARRKWCVQAMIRDTSWTTILTTPQLQQHETKEQLQNPKNLR